MPVQPRRQTTYTSIVWDGRQRSLLMRLLRRPAESWVMRRQGWVRRGNLWIRRP